MSERELAARIEVTKLAHDLGRPVSDLEFLAVHPASEIAELRTLAASTLVSRHSGQATLLASLSRRIPAGVSAKIASHALGPVVSARVAAALAPDEAARMAAHFDAEFLTRLARHLDPAKVAPVVTQLPDKLVVDLGRRLLAAGEYVTLGRFVTLVAVEVGLRVVEGATGEEIFQVGLYAEDRSVLDELVGGLSDAQRAGIVAAADEHDARDLLPPALT